MMSKISKREYLRAVQKDYRKATKKRKTQLLSDFCSFTGYNRKYAIGLLGSRIPAKYKRYRKRANYYDQFVREALVKIWVASDHICGERLHPFIPEMMTKLEECGELFLHDETRSKLLKISLGTVKKLLRSVKQKTRIKLRGTTKPGTLLKHQIAIRCGPWEEVVPGFFEMDTVAHCGGTLAGDFIYSLDLVDIVTSWSEQAAIWGKGERATLAQLEVIVGRLPFPILGVDPDNGSEFINWHLFRYCEKNNITLTRSRAYRKNDNAHIEQKNYTAIRQLVGYNRFDQPKQLDLLNDLYANEWRLYLNFFQPVMKLKEKTKDAKTGRTKKKYDPAKTPYRRLLDHPAVPEETKQQLQAVYKSLNPIQLRQQIQAKLLRFKKTLKSDS